VSYKCPRWEAPGIDGNVLFDENRASAVKSGRQTLEDNDNQNH